MIKQLLTYGVSLASVVGLLAWPVSSWAQQSYTAAVSAGSNVTYYGSGFTPSSRVVIVQTSGGQTWTVVPTSVNNQTLQYQVPQYLPAGMYTTAVVNGANRVSAPTLQVQSYQYPYYCMQTMSSGYVLDRTYTGMPCTQYVQPTPYPVYPTVIRPTPYPNPNPVYSSPYQPAYVPTGNAPGFVAQNAWGLAHDL